MNLISNTLSVKEHFISLSGPLSKNLTFLGSLLIALVGFAKPALAYDPGLESSYRASTNLLLKEIQRSGLEELRTTGVTVTSMTELRETLEKTTFRTTYNFEKPEDSTRHGAFCDPENKIVYLNERAMHSVNHFGILGLHELLCLQKVPDRNYELTLLLKNYADRTSQVRVSNDTLLTALKIEIQNFLKETRGKQDKREYLKLAGGTAVGGGGDTRGIDVKARLVRMHLYNLQKWIENNPEVSVGEVAQRIRPIVRLEVEKGRHMEGVLVTYETDGTSFSVKGVSLPYLMYEHEAALEVLKTLGETP